MADPKSTTPVELDHLLDRPLRCVVVTPEATILDQPAEFIALPLYDGEVGIGRGHSPLIGRLGYGEMRLRSTDDKTVRYYIDGGFVQVVGNVVSVLTSEAILATEIDPGVAAEQLRTAHRQVATSDALFEQRDRLEAQARAQLRLARNV
ncbi:MAG TPA: ATP synthase F1 subunit epsilon [Pirellulales bacterium]